MKPIEFEGQNRFWQPPPGYPRGTCGILPAFVDDLRSISYWKPTSEEIEALKNGSHICLTVMGQQPPVSLHVQKAKELP